jgi:23S rRNA (uridine2479-2'-O)-methyltransferase
VRALRISSRNARFQQWQAALTNRTKRQRGGEFLVQGVRPITVAVEQGFPLAAMLYDDSAALSDWAIGVLDRADAQPVAMAPELIGELGERAEEPPELVAVARLPADDLDRIPVADDFLGVVFDRPTNPGNIGSLMRSLDAFGGHGMVVTGHAADPYDPRAVRGSTGSLFALPVVRVASHRDVLAWLPDHVTVVGTDEHGAVELAGHDLRGPTLLVVGNETAGMSAGWREACHQLVRIPMTGTASSLNAANAGTVALYETARQRRSTP